MSSDPPASALDFRITPEELQNAASSTDTSAQLIAQELAAIKTYVLGLEGAWTGSAAQTFQNLMTDYDIFARMLNDALTDIAAGLRGNHVNYEGAETANLGSLIAINGTIPGSGGFD